MSRDGLSEDATLSWMSTSSQLVKKEQSDECFCQEHAWHLWRPGWEGAVGWRLVGEKRAGGSQTRGAPGDRRGEARLHSKSREMSLGVFAQR